MTATKDPAPPAGAGRQSLPPQPQEPASPGRAIVQALGSMKLTVVVLLLLALLTLLGTFAQQDQGLFYVVRDYFTSLYVLHDTGIHIGSRTIRIPLPGAYPLLALLTVNLIVGGLLRMKWQLRNAGILITHAGMLLLLFAGFVKMHWSYSGHVSLREGETSQTIVSFHDYELALIRSDGEQFFERTVPESALQGARNGTVVLRGEGLPFEVRVHHWLDNCRPTPKGPMFDAPTPVVGDGAGPGVFLRPMEPHMEREANQPGCYVTVVENDGGTTHEGILYGLELRPHDHVRYPFTFEVGGTTWGLDLRRVVWDLPFAVRLDRFQKEDHPGTMTPRDFSSFVTVQEPGGAERKVHIFMNQPLRKDGYVFFQTNWGPQPGSGMRGPPFWSVFEVADNPSDAWPKYASYVILIGLLWHFVQKLLRHLRSSNYRASTP